MTAPRRPPGLGPRGARFWREVSSRYDMNPAEAELLTEACRACDTIDGLRAALDGSELVVAGSMGQERVNPLAVALLAAQDNLRRLLGSLGLPDSDGNKAQVSDELAPRRRIRASGAR